MKSAVAQHVQAIVTAMTLQVINSSQRAYYGESVQLTQGDRSLSSPVYGLADSQQRVTDMDDQEYQSWACMVNPGTMNLIPHMGNFGAAEDIGSLAQQVHRHRKTITDFFNPGIRGNGSESYVSAFSVSNMYDQGEDVFHDKWGAGVVIRCDGNIATVRFGGWDDGHVRKVHADWLKDEPVEAAA